MYAKTKGAVLRPKVYLHVFLSILVLFASFREPYDEGKRVVERQPSALQTVIRVGTATPLPAVQLKLHFPNPILTKLSILEEA